MKQCEAVNYRLSYSYSRKNCLNRTWHLSNGVAIVQGSRLPWNLLVVQGSCAASDDDVHQEVPPARGACHRVRLWQGAAVCTKVLTFPPLVRSNTF